MDLNPWQTLLAEQKQKLLWRELKPQDAPPTARFAKGNQSWLNFVSNNYLGLATHPQLIKTAQEWTATWGTGSGGSRLLGGDREYHHTLQTALSNWKGLDSSLLFNNGYSANLAIGQCLHSLNVSVFADRLCHASIWDGLTLGKVRFQRYHHCDLEHLESLLKKAKTQPVILTESVFSMDGDTAPLTDLAKLASKYNALLIVDEAHAEGVLGESGKGLCHNLKINSEQLLIMGTFGKAMGSFGAYIGGSQTFIDFFINFARSFIYSTSLPASVCGANYAAIEVVQTMDAERQHLQLLQHTLKQEAQKENWSLGQTQSQIIPFLLGDNDSALKASHVLARHNILGQAVRAPTVPIGTARLRLNLMATHSLNDLQELIQCLQLL